MKSALKAVLLSLFFVFFLAAEQVKYPDILLPDKVKMCLQKPDLHTPAGIEQHYHSFEVILLTAQLQ